MTSIQKFFKAILPKRLGEEMEEESKSWKFECECGRTVSIWEIGGIRWRAKGNPKTLIACPHCGKKSLQVLKKY